MKSDHSNAGILKPLGGTWNFLRGTIKVQNVRKSLNFFIYTYFSLVIKNGYPKTCIDNKGYSTHKSLRVPDLMYSYIVYTCIVVDAHFLYIVIMVYLSFNRQWLSKSEYKCQPNNQTMGFSPI